MGIHGSANPVEGTVTLMLGVGYPSLGPLTDPVRYTNASSSLVASS
jgi:hypothetical protein